MKSDTKLCFRLPAEWEMDGAVLLAWPHGGTDWNYMLDDVRECFRDIVTELVKWTKVVVVAPDVDEAASFLSGIGMDRIIYFAADTNDTWTRDYGPLSVEGNDGAFRVCKFRFNGWGLKFAACHDNNVVMKMSDSGLISAPLRDHRDFVLEGGGIESDGCGMLMTTAECQLSVNRNPTVSREIIEERLKAWFGGEKVIWLEHGFLAGDDTDSHIDTLARFAPSNTIVYTGCDDTQDEHFGELQAMKAELMGAVNLAGEPFNLIELPLPDAIYDEDGLRLPATYANFLALPDVVLMPEYGQPHKDIVARQMLQMVFDVPVIGIDCRALIRQHGSLHCMTMQMPSQILAI